MRLKIVGIVGILAAVIFVGSRFGNRKISAPREAPSGSSNAARSADIATIDDEAREEIAKLQRELRAQSAKITALSAQSTKTIEPDTAEDHKDEVPETTPARSPAQQAALLEEQMASEGSDAAWSRAAEGQIRDKLEGRVIEGLRGAGVTCAATLCRIDAEFDTVKARDFGLRELATSVPWGFDGFYRADPSDERKMSFFVTRKDHALPTYQDAIAATSQR